MEKTAILLTNSGIKIKTKAVYYNKSLGKFQDVIEVFEQRLKEIGPGLEDRMELFLPTIGNGGTVVDKFIKNGFSTVDQINDLKNVSLKLRLESIQKIIKNPTDLNYETHKTQLNKEVKAGLNIVLVAHSQGNLFVNKVYENQKNKNNNPKIQVIHVAPASLKLYGDWILADQDYVINTLRTTATGKVPSYTDRIGNFSERIRKEGLSFDYSGHAFDGTYINKRLSTYAHFVDEASLISRRFKVSDCGLKNKLASEYFKTLKENHNFSTICNKGNYTNNCVHIPVKAVKSFDEKGYLGLGPEIRSVFDICNEKGWYMFDVRKKQNKITISCENGMKVLASKVIEF